MRSKLVRRLPALLLTLSIPFPLVAQTTPPEVRLGAPERVLEVDFTRVAGARELADGRLMLTDRGEDKIVVADLVTGRLQTLGRPGSGPAEYRRPGRVIVLPGDSSLVTDEGNERFLVIAPDLRIVRTMRFDVPGLPSMLYPRTVDRSGRYYAVIPRWMAEPSQRRGDSLPLVRWSQAGSRPETVAWVVSLA